MAGKSDIIFERRSIRSYASQPIPRDAIKRILEAAMSAPSAHNEQPWHFLVIDGRETLNAIAGVHPYAKMCLTAQCAILVCMDSKLEKAAGYAPVDCGNATMSILLAAQAEGIGSVWVGVYPKQDRMEEMEKLLSLPAGIAPFALVPLGYPAEKRGKENRYKEERVHYNKW